MDVGHVAQAVGYAPLVVPFDCLLLRVLGQIPSAQRLTGRQFQASSMSRSMSLILSCRLSHLGDHGADVDDEE